jgi:hypothetical protein
VAEQISEAGPPVSGPPDLSAYPDNIRVLKNRFKGLKIDFYWVASISLSTKDHKSGSIVFNTAIISNFSSLMAVRLIDLVFPA